MPLIDDHSVAEGGLCIQHAVSDRGCIDSYPERYIVRPYFSKLNTRSVLSCCLLDAAAANGNCHEYEDTDHGVENTGNCVSN